MIAVVALTLLAQAQGAALPVEEPIARTTVGMRVRIDEVPIRGPQLRARPVADPVLAEVILRVINVFPHGDSFRYNLEVTPFVEGRIDLRDHLELLDGASPDDVPPLIVEVGAVLPGGVMAPNEVDVPEPAGVGGYRTRMVAFGVLWGAGLLALLFVGRRRRGHEEGSEEAKPVTLAQRLRPSWPDTSEPDPTRKPPSGAAWSNSP